MGFTFNNFIKFQYFKYRKGIIYCFGDDFTYLFVFFLAGKY